MFDMDFHENSCDKMMSADDAKFLKQLEEGIHLREDGHIELPLPKRTSQPLPSNRSMAEKRAHSLKKRLLKDPQLRADYTSYMTKLINDDYTPRICKIANSVKCQYITINTNSICAKLLAISVYQHQCFLVEYIKRNVSKMLQMYRSSSSKQC